MNVLLVPAHPGFPGQIPQSRKTVVVVVVVYESTHDDEDDDNNAYERDIPTVMSIVLRSPSALRRYREPH